jgi:hypothetical protein
MKASDNVVFKRGDFEGIAHEIFTTAQLLPGEGIEDAVKRIVEVLEENAHYSCEGNT